MDLEQTVCYCMSVTGGMIRDAVNSGANTLEEVQGITMAGTVCGSCLEEVKGLVERFVSERDGQ
ncbi:MAG: (2Fe-2S)-binding protein [Blautia sp.]|nr:(2Fe-2S)-binding protein [Blautia sp.]